MYLKTDLEFGITRREFKKDSIRKQREEAEEEGNNDGELTKNSNNLRDRV